MGSLRWILLAMAFVSMPASRCDAAPETIRGQWIWTADSGDMRNSRAYFRRTFLLEGDVARATAKIAADSRYILYVNGRKAGRGAPRSYLKATTYDTYELAPFLQKGFNTFAVLVHHYGEATGQYELGRSGLLFDASIVSGGNTTTINSDSGWKCLLDTAWARNQDRMASGLGFPEVLDARLLPKGWETTGFDDSRWRNASVIGPAGMAPWTGLVSADIPPLRETVIYPKEVLDVRAVEPPADFARIDFSAQYVDNRTPAIGYASTWVFVKKDTGASLRIGRSGPCRLWVNGRSVLSYASVRTSPTATDIVRCRLKSGWNRVLLKSVKVSQRWNAWVRITCETGAKAVVSATRDASRPDTWHISPQYLPADGDDASRAFSTPGKPEQEGASITWSTVTAPERPIPFVATVIRFQGRSRSDKPDVVDVDTLTRKEASAVFPAASKRDTSVLLDMGVEVAGYPRIVIRGARGGEIIDLSYAEALEDADGRRISPDSGRRGILNPERDDVRYADRLICAPGDNTFEVFERRAFRYLQLDVRNRFGPLTVTSLAVVQATYPVSEVGRFECSDKLLNHIWDIGRRTVLLNMEDAYTDCPWRERVQWWGDARVETLANFYAFGDGRLMRRGLIQGAQSLTPEGVIQGMFPSGWTNETTQVPSYGLLWVISLWEYYLYTGDSSLFPLVRSAMDRFFAFLDSHIDSRTGLLSDVPHWIFIDWAEGMSQQNTGVSACMNLMYIRALESASRLATDAGDTAGSGRYASRAVALKSAFHQRLWNGGWGLYADRLLKGEQSDTVSQHANALALLWDVASPGERNGIANALVRNKTLIQTGTPYFGEFIVEALESAGHHDEALNFIRDMWGPMIKWGATTFWEGWDGTGSLCHGWAGGPTYSLPAWSLGIRPTQPGWREWEMAPFWGDLKWAKGVVPTPHGSIEASWKRSRYSVHAELTVPPGTSGIVRIPSTGLEKAKWTVDGQAALPAGMSRLDAQDFWSIRITRPGVYRIDGKAG